MIKIRHYLLYQIFSGQCFPCISYTDDQRKQNCRLEIEAGMMRIESVPFSIRGLIHSIQTMFLEKINEKGLNIRVVVDETIPDAISGDATRLTQILVNITGNAIKFSQAGTVNININNLGFADNLIRLEFDISDTGIGIAKEKLSAIFERFHQAEDSITRKYGDSGLGLSIVKDLVLLQNGEITVESELGRGTTFRFIIPYKIAEGEMDYPMATADSMPGYRGLQNTHILVVDDNAMNQNLLKYLLTEWKLSFSQATNAREAIEKLKEGRYDLVLMDIQMPGMDGYTATQEIRQTLKLSIPVIAMTAHAFAGEREKCLSYGMNEYIAKPISDKELFRLIKQFTWNVESNDKLKKDLMHEDTTAYQVINLLYMRDISNGNKEYEKTVTEQFIEAIPLDTAALESACTSMDETTLRQATHNMKTNISVMGLLEKLRPYLDELEYEPFDKVRFQQTILSIKRVCLDALPEAHHFYSTLHAD